MRSVTVAFVLGLLASISAPRPAAATDCASHNDCGSFQLCVDGACVDVEPTGEACEGDADCGDGFCLDGFCYAPSGAPIPICTSDADCDGGVCVEGYCMDEHVPECEIDADCGEGGVCLEGGFCSFDGGEAPTDCESDADCTAEQICVWNMCMEKESGYCHNDADCGSGMVCNGCYCESSEGTCATDADCGSYETCQTLEEMGAEPAAPGAAEGDGCQYTRGWCLLDVDSIPANPRCDAFCAAVMPCEGTGEGTSGGGAATGGGSGGSESQEMALEGDDEECAKFCSYLLLDGDGQDEAEALVGCVEQNAEAGCETLFDACSDEVDATAAAFEETYTDVDAGEAPVGGGEPGGEGGGTTRNSLGDTLAAAFGKGGLAGGGDGGDGGDGGAGGTDDGGAAGCSLATTPATGAAALLTLLLFLALAILRRQRV